MSGETPPIDDVQFDIPDLVVQYAYPSKTVTLEAFKVRNRTATEKPKWVSVGYPTIVNGTNGQLFHFTAEYVAAHINVLGPVQKNALVEHARKQYPLASITSESIIPLPLAQFSCGITFYINTTGYEIRGNVFDLRTNPLLLRFPLHEGNEKRLLFEERIRLSDPLFLECELLATGKQEKVNSLKITMEQMQELGLADKLLGSADEKYVTRHQLAQVAQEVKLSLHIEEY